MKLKLLRYPDPALLTKCDPVEYIDKELKAQIKHIKNRIHKSKGRTMGYAANQFGIMKRFFIIRYRGETQVFINPSIRIPEEVKEFTNTKHPEACESSFGTQVMATVPSRAITVILAAVNEKAKPIGEIYSGLMAICIQHEYDHLDGIFWFDKLPKEKRVKVLEQYTLLGGKVSNV